MRRLVCSAVQSDKPHASGGMALSRYAASAVLALFILICIALLPQRPERVSAQA